METVGNWKMEVNFINTHFVPLVFLFNLHLRSDELLWFITIIPEQQEQKV